MDSEFWQARWQRNEIGFHLAEVHPLLVQYWPLLNPAPGAAVLVPLCGKSRDMYWLRTQGHEVFGVEFSPIAIRDFFHTAGWDAEQDPLGDFTRWRGGGVTLLAGDFFALTRAMLPAVSLVYDRAALIALPPEVRGRYAEHLQDLLAPQARILLITLEYPQEAMSGPPFAVYGDEVEQRFPPPWRVRSLMRRDVLADNAHLQAAGLSRLDEVVYLVER